VVMEPENAVSDQRACVRCGQDFRPVAWWQVVCQPCTDEEFNMWNGRE